MKNRLLANVSDEVKWEMFALILHIFFIFEIFQILLAIKHLYAIFSIYSTSNLIYFKEKCFTILN